MLPISVSAAVKGDGLGKGWLPKCWGVMFSQAITGAPEELARVVPRRVQAASSAAVRRVVLVMVVVEE